MDLQGSPTWLTLLHAIAMASQSQGTHTALHFGVP